MKLYQHQIVAKELLREGYGNKKKRLILTLPTGGGKTVAASSIISDSLENGSGAKLILVDRMELLNQWSDTLHKFGIDHKLLRSQAYSENFMPKKVYLGMVESVWSRMKKRPDYLDKLNIQFIINDECHKFAFNKILNGYQGHVLGLTATPLSSNPKGALNDYYDDIVIPIDAPELIISGHIVGSRTYSIEHDWTGLKKTTKGEYSEASQMLHFGKAKFIDGLVGHWKNYATGKATIVYNVNIEHSIETTNNFNRAGISCEHMDGTMSQDERDGILKRFRSGETQVISNVHLLTTGNDEKLVECIALNRKIGLISTNIQAAGRGARSHVFPDGRRKRNFVCLDMGCNHERHGVFGERIDWRAIFNEPKLAKDNKASSREESIVCNTCAGVNPKRLDNCLYCKQVLNKKPKVSFSDLMAPSPERLQIIRETKINSLPEDLQGMKPGQMTADQLWRYIDHMGFKKSYFYIIMKNRRH